MIRGSRFSSGGLLAIEDCLLTFTFCCSSHCQCDEAFLGCVTDASRYDDMAPIVGNIFFNLVRPRCLTHPREMIRRPKKELSSPQLLDSVGPEDNGARGSPPPYRNIYKPRLECTLYDRDDNSCRNWVNNPKSIPLKLKIVTPTFTFKAPPSN